MKMGVVIQPEGAIIVSCIKLRISLVQKFVDVQIYSMEIRMMDDLPGERSLLCAIQCAPSGWNLLTRQYRGAAAVHLGLGFQETAHRIQVPRLRKSDELDAFL